MPRHANFEHLAAITESMNDSLPVLMLSRDAALNEAVEASALALDVNLVIEQAAEDISRQWNAAPLRLLAPAMAARAATLGARGATYVVGRDPAELVRASAELSCPALMLPDDSARLADVLVQAADGDASQARVVSVAAAGGGLGASTLAVGLGQQAALSGVRAVVVELALGGGLDLLVGKETAKGVRWSDLARARGELGGLDDALPEVDGLRVLALDRQQPLFPDHLAIQAVMAALRRCADCIVVDDRGGLGVDADTQLLLVGADVRGVATARMVAGQLADHPTGLVVRTGHGRRLGGSAVAQSLGVSLMGELREDRALARLAELGQPPLRGPAKRFRRDVAAVWEVLAGE